MKLIIFQWKILNAFSLTVLSFVTICVMKFLLSKFRILIDVTQPVSAMKSIEMSPNLAVMPMQRLASEVAADNLGVNC